MKGFSCGDLVAWDHELLLTFSSKKELEIYTDHVRAHGLGVGGWYQHKKQLVKLSRPSLIIGIDGSCITLLDRDGRIGCIDKSIMGIDVFVLEWSQP